MYPGYQRFFSRAVGIFGVGRRSIHLRPWAEATSGELTETGNRARKVSGTQGTKNVFVVFCGQAPQIPPLDPPQLRLDYQPFLGFLF